MLARFKLNSTKKLCYESIQASFLGLNSLGRDCGFEAVNEEEHGNP